MAITKIISGGQTGADQAGLAAGRILGLPTGGWAPLGYRTEAGLQHELLVGFGLLEHPSGGYAPRTRTNIENADGTIIFGDVKSVGSQMTHAVCCELHKPAFVVQWPSPVLYDMGHWTRDAIEKDARERYSRTVNDIRNWLGDMEIETLNVAGNRESRNPGIFNYVRDFLVEVLKV